MEVHALAHDKQSYTMLRHITANHDSHILINGVPGLGKTTMASSCATLYGQSEVQGTSFGKNCVEGMIEKGICDSATLHAKSLAALTGEVRRTKLFTLLDREESIKREPERVRKAEAILNTMYPPQSMREGQLLTALTNRTDGTSIAMQIEELKSMQCKVYGKFIATMMDAAMTARFGLKEILGPKNRKTKVQGKMDAGPDVDDRCVWAELAHQRFVDAELVESIHGLESDVQEELFTHLRAKLQTDEFNLHEAVVDDFLSICPKVFKNMFSFFNVGSIMLPDGDDATTRVWMFDEKTGAIVYNHRSMITYQEMMWIARKLNIKLMSTHKAMFFVDEWNDLSPLHLDVLLKICMDAQMIARLCNKPPMQFVFGGDVGQMIYGFQGTLANPLDAIMTAFAIDVLNCLIGDQTHRPPDAVIEYTNDHTFRYPNAFLDPHRRVIQIKAAKPGRTGLVREKVNIDQLDLPPAVDLAQGDALDNVQTVAALARNQKDVEEFWQGRVAQGQDWSLRLPGRIVTTHQVLLDQLKFFEKNNMTTKSQMRSWLASKEHVISYAYQRKAFDGVLADDALSAQDDGANVLVTLDALIKAKYAHKSSRIAGTMHGAKGEQFHTVLILKPESVPSGKACQVEHSHPAIYHSDLHLLYVAYTHAMHTLLIAETEAQREAREKLESEGMADSQSSVLDMLNDERQPEMLDESNKDANPEAVLQNALDTLELPASPSTLRELSTYVKTKRKYSAFEGNGLEEFDRASKVVRRHLMFSDVAGCSTLGAPPPAAANQGAGTCGQASAVADASAGGERNAAVDALIQSKLNDLTHLTPEQRTVAKEWLEQGFNIAEADAAAIHLYSYEAHASKVAQAADEGRELQWQTLLATALGAGEWAHDWHTRHRALLDANDSVLAAALADLE